MVEIQGGGMFSIPTINTPGGEFDPVYLVAERAFLSGCVMFILFVVYGARSFVVLFIVSITIQRCGGHPFFIRLIPSPGICCDTLSVRQLIGSVSSSFFSLVVGHNSSPYRGLLSPYRREISRRF